MRHILCLRPNLIAVRSGPNFVPWNSAELARAGIDSSCFPLTENTPPRAGDFEHCLALLPLAPEYLLTAIEPGEITLVHCTASKNRSALIVSHYLCQCEGYSPRDAIREVRRVRPIALPATGYEDIALGVLGAPHGD